MTMDATPALRLTMAHVIYVLTTGGTMNTDSLEMTDADRVLILRMVRAILNKNAPIVITHGTDTFVQTGFYVQRALPNLQMPIVLTGGMTPLEFEGSDGTPEPH